MLSLVALGAAQNQTVSLFLPNTDMQSLVGSIVGGYAGADGESINQDATATTYVVQCANGGSNGAAATTAAAATDTGNDNSSICGYPTPVTIVEGPSTVAYSIALDASTLSINCVLSGSSVAVCTAPATAAILTQETGIPSLRSITLSGTDVSFLPVVITAGSVTNTGSTPISTTASTTGGAKGGSEAGSNGGSKTSSTSSTGGTQTQTGSTTSASTKASGAAVHMGPAMGMGAAGALAAVAAVVL
ncbi:MAG: hypothetical protein Q9175_004871 [Cornicularia normoerica]